ncbi:MAG: ATP-dependent transcriptional regulator [Firmicutes bacterium]|nr:ATP-dependent transcriptional regulator [Bacillota bacterium]MBP2657095.1 ATP-dependent transcriptional regulator [Bacillota bacterium]
MHDSSRMKLAGELEFLIGFKKYNSLYEMSKHNQRTRELLPGPAEFIDRNGSWTFGSPSVLYMFYRESGKLAQEVQEIIEAMPHYCRLTAGHGSGGECAVAELVATGLSNRVIGETLYIAEVTVKKVLQSIFVKMGINSRTALTKIVVEQKKPESVYFRIISSQTNSLYNKDELVFFGRNTIIKNMRRGISYE